MSSGNSHDERSAASVTRWQVYTLPRTDGVEFNLRLWTPTDDPEVIAKIERAAESAGMVIERLAPDAE